jgi:hypothetical protein
MSHTCHAYQCNNAVPPQMFMCREHWFSLDTAKRRLIWATYRPGQCDDMRITRAYADAAQSAIRYVASKEGKHIPVDAPELMLYERLAL